MAEHSTDEKDQRGKDSKSKCDQKNTATHANFKNLLAHEMNIRTHQACHGRQSSDQPPKLNSHSPEKGQAVPGVLTLQTALTGIDVTDNDQTNVNLFLSHGVVGAVLLLDGWLRQITKIMSLEVFAPASFVAWIVENHTLAQRLPANQPRRRPDNANP
jgi:hypothetical protein